MMITNSKKQTKAFTLIELLVVVTIIGLLVGIAIPVTISGIAKANKGKCASNMRQIGVYISLYEAETQLFPKIGSGARSQVIPWAYRLVEAGVLNDYASAPEIYREEEVFRCPEDKMASGGIPRPSYAINNELALGDGITDIRPSNRPQNVREPSKTILLGETHANRDQVSYLSIRQSDVSSGASFLAFDQHDGKANFLFVDGHMEFLSREETLDPANNINLWDL